MRLPLDRLAFSSGYATSAADRAVAPWRIAAAVEAEHATTVHEAHLVAIHLLCAAFDVARQQ